MSTCNARPEEDALKMENGKVPFSAFSESKEQKVIQQPRSSCQIIENIPKSGASEEDVQVNIVGSGSGTFGGKAVEDACDEATDSECSSSSSFGDTDSGTEDASCSAFTNTEIESLPICDGDQSKTSLSRKNKARTWHWRSFIHPVKWRCKWLELQVKKLNTLALKYDKELAAYDHRKQLEFSKFTIDDLNVKSVPIYDGTGRNKVMKRKKRNKTEEHNLSSYISKHSIFSYYENKNQGTCVEDSCGDTLNFTEEFKFNDTLSTADLEDNDKTIIDVIKRIEELQSHVGKLKTRIDNVVRENPGKLCSVTQLGMTGPSDGLHHSGHNSSSLICNDNTFPVRFVRASSPYKSELNKEDLFLNQNTLPTRAMTTPFIETTNMPQHEFLPDNTEYGILIQNQAAKEELHDFESGRNQFMEKTKESVEEHKSMSPENAVSALQVGSASNSNLRRSKRRGRRKIGSKGWKRR
ncbi:uncharacterized protein HKW66_Vig0110580 [Vigna angularis]|uniref:Uncharacterized protein n=2 Tax=Phaseolus angularis TaxID=3914 RepID=A0A8T0KWJ7_PHAAN|nr:uncharacterized protein LOC108327757 [Vigna angularis]XP_017416945.1 uncharacterized protein LOC108327757 [Vigna angularis]KAG2404136.1 uncharacterized protein HKW66_Vig0110580 [Vigna angularis]BAT83426.1 hypothetical protein VIGAN_04056900 [Vigna angularis var. angularis]